jgi:transposase
MTGIKKSRFTEEQIIGFIRQAEAGMPVRELCRKRGFSDATFYKWRAKYGGMDVPDAKRLKFAAQSERLDSEQRSLLEETLDADLQAVSEEIERLVPQDKPAGEKNKPKRQPLPPQLPRREIHHEPENTTCSCGCQMKRIGEDVTEKLDYQPGVFTVERHVRGKWACAKCEKLVQVAVAPHVIDKGLATAGLLAQVLVAKYADHLPLYRQEGIFARAGLAIPRSTLAQWVGSCGVQLQPLVDAMRAELLQQPVLHAERPTRPWPACANSWAS